MAYHLEGCVPAYIMLARFEQSCSERGAVIEIFMGIGFGLLWEGTLWKLYVNSFLIWTSKRV
jgi:hypothetical protein